MSFNRNGGRTRTRSFNSRSTRGNSGGFGRGGRRGGNFSRSKFINPEKFINKSMPISDEENYVVETSFKEMGLSPELLKNILSKGFEHPMPIQDMTIPHALEGKDVIGLANTGTGKTAAFLIPLIEKTLKSGGQESTLIMAPTRELAEQIKQELFELTKGMKIFSVLIIGGSSMGKQLAFLRKPNQFVIGTPGRIKDLNQRGALRFDRFTNVVLDEVDRMFDMGFQKEISAILAQIPEGRQSLFFSATINSSVDALIKQNSKDAVRVSVVKAETTDHVEQNIIRAARYAEKLEKLHDLLIKDEFEKILIFDKTKRGVHKLQRELKDRGFKADSIHGDKSQSQRRRSLSEFSQGNIDVLVATDVAARGLDIPDVSHVINFDTPDNYSDYIHRIGRTGRGGKRGVALTFVA